MNRLYPSQTLTLRTLIACFILACLLASCSSSHSVVSEHGIQKRKYRKGFHWSQVMRRKAKTAIAQDFQSISVSTKKGAVDDLQSSADSARSSSVSNIPTIEKIAPPPVAKPGMKAPKAIVSQHDLVRHSSKPTIAIQHSKLQPTQPANGQKKGDDVPTIKKVFAYISFIAACIAFLGFVFSGILGVSGVIAFFYLVTIGVIDLGGLSAAFFPILLIPAALMGGASLISLFIGFVSGILSFRTTKMPVVGIIGLSFSGAMVLAIFAVLFIMFLFSVL